MKLSQILSLSLIFSYSLFSQDKAIVPTSGTIAFEKSEKITDSLLYKKSISELNIKIIDNEYLKIKIPNIQFETISSGEFTITNAFFNKN